MYVIRSQKRLLTCVLNVFKLPGNKEQRTENNFMEMLKFCDIWVLLVDAKGSFSKSIYKYHHEASSTNSLIGSPETRVFILVALARVNMSHWFMFIRASATRIKKRVSGLPMIQLTNKHSQHSTPCR